MSSTNSSGKTSVYPHTIVSPSDHFVSVKWWDSREKYSALFERLTDDDVIALVGFERRGGEGHSFKNPSLSMVPQPVQNTIKAEGFTIAEVADNE
ncbi:hypothetical protein Htur_5278 (plasmid) [Haloterrigena turkmenica DSM 5511]|uniref:Uncharacterized protein n=1 Tax=Haloterrigena turkmenica (strain ATCC 51198 / DSM 5511 / JCM 9101 / NCIMB 13204 / VKM B-1734 / 4k) TaxID=543526 RepID=D2S3Q9_HALTV|nr:hypothetical protein Htur_5278 [Haloterrigena turkmenica DSM 5511]